MKNHLKCVIAVSLFSLAAHADTSTNPRSNADIFLSSPAHTFELEINSLILKPTGGDLHYAAEAVPLPLPSPHWKIQDIHTDYHYGFDIGLRGIFHSAYTFLSLNWERFHASDSASKKVSSNNMIGPFFEIGPDASVYKKAHGNVSFHFDEVNLDYGIFMNFGERLQTNLFAGVSFARIKQTLTSKYSNYSGSIRRTIKTPSSFMGAGPQLGLEFGYKIVEGFHLNGKARASLFIGTQKNHTSYKSFDPALGGLGITPPNKQSTQVSNATQIVPGLEGALGLSYVFSFRKHYMVKLEAGYQAQVYIDSIQSVDIGSEVNTPPVAPDTVGVFARTFEKHLNNFALSGPYALIVLGF
ncbi:MAG: hypothetical protein JSS61_04580 [Verrucomicrobia bacterium]|nr:hypothetical protein [Verrucomicrobiota bacterium]